MIRNTVLYAATKAYVQAGLALVAGRCRPGDGTTLETTTWERSGPEEFVQKSMEGQSWSECISRHVRDLHLLSEYADLLELMRADAMINAQLTIPSGSMHPWVRTVADQITDGLLLQIADWAADFRMDEAGFQSLYTAIEDALYTDTTEVQVKALLQHLVIDANPIELGSGVSLDVMTDDELSAFIGSGFIRSTIRDPRVVHVESHYGVRLRYRAPKIVHERSLFDLSQILDAEATIEELVEALRLFKHGAISSPGYIGGITNWLGARTFYMPMEPLPFRRRPSYHLPQEEVAEFVDLWRYLKSDGARRDKVFGNALRRFGYAGERTRRVEDRLIDLMISAESVFLSDSGSSQYRGELRYRLALRAAFFLRSEGADRREVYDLMRRAYDVRSRIVHGDTPESVAVASRTMSLDEFAVLIEEHMRAALKKRATIFEGGQSLDWEDLILGR